MFNDFIIQHQNRAKITFLGRFRAPKTEYLLIILKNYQKRLIFQRPYSLNNGSICTVGALNNMCAENISRT